MHRLTFRVMILTKGANFATTAHVVGTKFEAMHFVPIKIIDGTKFAPFCKNFWILFQSLRQYFIFREWRKLWLFFPSAQSLRRWRKISLCVTDLFPYLLLLSSSHPGRSVHSRENGTVNSMYCHFFEGRVLWSR